MTEMSCAALRRRVEAGAPEAGFVFERGEVEHLAACAPCRKLVSQADPTALFALLSLERKDESFWTGFETRVLAAVREEKPARGGVLAALGVLLRPRVLALAAGSLLIALLALKTAITSARKIESVENVPASKILVVPGRRNAQEPGQQEPGTSRVAQGPPTVPGGGTGPGTEVARLPRFPLERDAADPAPVEPAGSSSARSIIMFKVGEPDKEQSDLVMIIDPEMDI